MTRTIITHVLLIDGTGRAPLADAWIRIADGRIEAIGQGEPPEGDHEIRDASGRTVLPGLSDMHVHLGPEPQARWILPLMLAHGITNLKDAGNSLGDLAGIRRTMAAGGAFPHLYISGRILTAGMNELAFLKSGPALARELADLSAFGVDFLKVHNWVSSAALEQIVAFGEANDLWVTGHVPLSVTSVAALDAGMRVLEHVRLHPGETIDDPAVVGRYALDLQVMRRTAHWAHFRPGDRAGQRTLDAWEQRRDRFFSDPTLVVQESLANDDRPEWIEGLHLGLISPALRENWRKNAKFYGELDREHYVEAKASVGGMQQWVALAHARGIRILTGTDTTVPWTVPGASLHRELELLVEAGLSPVEVIRASTGNAAQAFRRSDRGIITAGQEADLVIARGDVASDIRALRNIEWVILGGRFHARDELLARARTAADAHVPAVA